MKNEKTYYLPCAPCKEVKASKINIKPLVKDILNLIKKVLTNGPNDMSCVVWARFHRRCLLITSPYL